MLCGSGQAPRPHRSAGGRVRRERGAGPALCPLPYLTVRPSCSPGASDAFIIRFVCNDDVYPGNAKFLHQDIDSGLGIRNTFFELETALACVPSPVDCQVTGKSVCVCGACVLYYRQCAICVTRFL